MASSSWGLQDITEENDREANRSFTGPKYAALENVDAPPSWNHHISLQDSEESASTCTRWRAAVSNTLTKPESSRAACVVHYLVVILIAVSTVTAILETVEEFQRRYADLFDASEVVITISFTLELVLRAWTSERLLVFFGQPSNMVDLIAVLPWYLEMIMQRFTTPLTQKNLSMDKYVGSFRTLRMVRFVRMVRLLRVLRIAKAARHSETVSNVIESIMEAPAGIFVLIFLVGVGSIFCATVVYAVESDAEDTQFTSIPMAMWWSLATITTVGYGDVVPVTILGKAMACLTMMFGMIIVSVSVAVVTQGFNNSYQRRMNIKIPYQARKRSDNFGLSSAEAPNPLMLHLNSLNVDSSRSHLDLVHTFASLEENTKHALSRLEALVLHMPHGVDSENAGSTAPPAGRRRSNSGSGDDFASVALRALREQSQAFFNAAMGLAEVVADVEAEAFNTGA